MCENVLDAENWKLEAQAVINDIKEHVVRVEISEVLQSSDRRIFLNLTTLEERDYCVELSGSGFRVVAERHDEISSSSRPETEEEHFETPYSLLNSLSPMFGQSFGDALMAKLASIQN
ncbi:PREDICTED: GSK3-beta interaction protein-like [Nicrophorus vespilloides]|uniref:GSK3-beta interaction protein-like n=1 Tax=Nicrophorus vespilloides TaxID=110193 RepID=A0ABM1NGB8_NICVS|nr:PREDICTED: GSK3-beta interaction protein-like [Nicrophorus vespilloides]XP_017785869.1 PREDICTED: GSK3-beta interaction protein-like [Nicrophorus vespilloides]